MNNALYIANSQIVFSFSRNTNIRKRLFEFEEYLNHDFQIPFRVIAIPDDIDPSIPRFESESKHKHSILQVSQQRITFKTNYDSQFKNDFQKIREYIAQKTLILSELAKKETIQFVGFVIELGVYMPSEEINIFLKNHTGVSAINDDCRDFSLFYSRKYKDNYYINIQCSKFQDGEIVFNTIDNTVQSIQNQNHGISVILDINTKPLLLENKEMDNTLFNTLEQEVFGLIDSKTIVDYLNGNI